MVELSALTAIILEEPGWRQLAEQVVRTNAFTTCFNVFEAALAIVRERRLKPSEAYGIILDAAARLAIEITDYEAEAIPLAVAGREKFGAGKRDSTWATAYPMELRRDIAPDFFMLVRTSLALTSTMASEIARAGAWPYPAARLNSRR